MAWQALAVCSLGNVRAVGVGHVQPERAGRHEHPVNLRGYFPELAHPGVNVSFESELSGRVVVAQPKVRRTGQHHVDG